MNLLAHLDIANHCVSCEINHRDVVTRDVVTIAVADVELGDCFPGRVASPNVSQRGR